MVVDDAAATGHYGLQVIQARILVENQRVELLGSDTGEGETPELTQTLPRIFIPPSKQINFNQMKLIVDKYNVTNE